MKTITTLVKIALISLASQFSQAAVCTAISNGDWSDPDIWSCGAVPGCGDIINIPSGITVNLDQQVHLDEESMPPCSTPVHIIVHGILHFQTGKKMYLSCGSTVEVMVGGEIQPGTGGGSSNLLVICQEELWSTDDGIVHGYAMFGEPVPLGPELMNFETVLSNNQLDISWFAANEDDINYYEISISNDGINWEENHQVNSNQVKTYQYHIELQQRPDILYITLTYYTFSGEKRTIATKSIENSKANYSVYPNPVKDGQTLNISNTETDKISTIDVIGMNGQVLKSLINFEENTSMHINLDDLQIGYYFIRINNSGMTYPIVKE